ncbi:DUF4349 domain-containing protein [Streptomyces indicus]|uniref:DUF4349 domain-containing protein n=1 Tax=Streptomyces indicus TaxID=417292 RepID=A0A1G9AQ00_9ACTN|nr:DUF4349 domain-containing protein [Streptomyces indicus]SDK28625.1 protein of unknown function [Streptomyces indicus]
MRTAPRNNRRRGTALAALLLSVMLAGAGCNGVGDADSGGDGAKGAAAAPQEEGGRAGNESAADSGLADGSGAKQKEPDGNPKLAQHIIRTANLRVRVESVPSALDKVRTAAADAGGIVGSETTDRDGKGNERSRIVLRVPQEQYGAVLQALEGTGKVLERSDKAEDVTEQVVDVDSRIKTQRASVERIRALMDKATKLSDVVTLESELSTRQADLESLLAQQASLKDRTSLATITLHLTESGAKPAPKDEDDPGFLDALSGGWNALVNVAKWIVIVLAAIAPWAAVLLILFLLWRLSGRRVPRRTPALALGGGGARPDPDAPDSPSTAPAPASPAPCPNQEPTGTNPPSSDSNPPPTGANPPSTDPQPPATGPKPPADPGA